MLDARYMNSSLDGATVDYGEDEDAIEGIDDAHVQQSASIVPPHPQHPVLFRVDLERQRSEVAHQTQVDVVEHQSTVGLQVQQAPVVGLHQRLLAVNEHIAR